ncbi:hypothetical protein [Microvirga sp. VF16]|uniref:hypothetical protein n=1 Tax=Microvirga sp. VF16 TaxID=2807101 RepID=UPI00193EAE39|nr:hypothetical protein [Microvirga sp. VF16]QRM32545.1 hypothetical protein JO965_31140 [Microvirga sp. VF16]
MAATIPNTARMTDDAYPDLAAFMIARAMAEAFQDEPDQSLPKPLAAILRQMETWKHYGQDAA